MIDDARKQSAVIQTVVIAVLFGWLHAPAIQLLADYAENDPNWSHAFVVPILSAYMIYSRWDQIRSCDLKPSAWGILLTGIGVCVHLWALSNRAPAILGYSMIVELIGIATALFGTKVLGTIWFPICFLAFAVRITTFWDRFAGAMQRVATELAGALLNGTSSLSGLRAEVQGSIIVLYDKGKELTPPLSVDEACSGLRMLVAIVGIAAAFAFLAGLRNWRAAILVGSSFPIALLVNVMRLACLGWLFPNHPDLATGNFHIQLGAAMFVPAFILLLAVQVVLSPQNAHNQNS